MLSAGSRRAARAAPGRRPPRPAPPDCAGCRRQCPGPSRSRPSSRLARSRRRRRDPDTRAARSSCPARPDTRSGNRRSSVRAARQTVVSSASRRQPRQIGELEPRLERTELRARHALVDAVRRLGAADDEDVPEIGLQLDGERERGGKVQLARPRRSNSAARRGAERVEKKTIGAPGKQLLAGLVEELDRALSSIAMTRSNRVPAVLQAQEIREGRDVVRVATT